MLNLPQRAGAVGVLVAAAALVSAPFASAHVTVDSTSTVKGDEVATLTFNVPNESETGSPTDELTVQLPKIKSVMIAPQTGWRAQVVRSADGTPTAVTWTADAGNPGIGKDQFGRFVVRVGPLPSDPSVQFPATQKYADGQTVQWNQSTPPGGAEPEHPAPSLTLTADTADAPSAPATADGTARWLGGIGLVAGVVGLVLGALALRRRS
jgi:uncharacterized protein YcnI